MSLIFLDGFETNSFHKWSNINNFFVSASPVRTGLRAMITSNSSGGSATRNFNVSDTTMIAGTGFRSSQVGRDYGVLRLQEGGIIHAEVRVVDNNWRINAGGVGSVDTFASLIPANTFVYVEMKVVVDDAAGSVEVRINDQTVMSFAGDTRNGGTGVIDTLVVDRSFGSNGNASWDDMYVCTGSGAFNNDFLGDSAVFPLLPNDNGTYSEFVGSDGNQVDNYQLVDEFPPSTADFVESATDGARDTYEFQDLVPPGIVRGVDHMSFAAKSDAGPRQFRHMQRIAGVDYATTGDHAPSVIPNYVWFTDLLETSPDTAVLWTIPEVNSSEFGIESRP